MSVRTMRSTTAHLAVILAATIATCAIDLGAGANTAWANKGAEEETRNPEKVCTVYDLNKILSMSIRELKGVSAHLAAWGSSFTITGFNEKTSRAFLALLLIDYSQARSLISELRSAKNDRQRNAVIDKAMAAKKKEAARIKAEYLVALDEVEAAAAKSPAARKVLNSIIFGLVEAVGGVDIYVKSTGLEDGISSRDLRKLEIFAGLKNLVSDANAYLGNLDYLRRYINRPANAKCE